jgi:hypothetical protein
VQITVNLHPSNFSVEFFEEKDGAAAFAALQVKCGNSKASIFLDEAKANELIRVGCAAKDMLHAAKHAARMAPAPGNLVTGPAECGEGTPGLRGESYHSPYTAGSAAEVAEGVTGAQAANGELAAQENEAVCGDRYPAALPGPRYVCTEPPGHDSFDHIATDSTGTEVASWPQNAVPDVASITEIPVIADAMAAQALAEVAEQEHAAARGEDL